MADNMDLFYIVQDFEEYYELKFQRKPKLVRKLEAGAGVKLPKVPGAARRQNSQATGSAGAGGSTPGGRNSVSGTPANAAAGKGKKP